MKKKHVFIFFLAAGLSLFATDSLADWSAAKRLTWSAGNSLSPAIAIDSGDTIHMVWSDGTSGDDELYYKQSTDGGLNWNAAKRLTWNSGASRHPATAVDSSVTIHVVWADDSPGNFEIFYMRGTYGGTTWGSMKRMTWTSDPSYSPALAIDAYNTIHVVWWENAAGSGEIYYKNSLDGGITWSAAKRLTWNSGHSDYPSIAIDAYDAIQVVWSDGTPGNYEIYYRRSIDGGDTWSAAKRLTWTSGRSWYPAVAVDASNTVHVVWSDDTPGQDEVYYIKSTNGGAAWSSARGITSSPNSPYSPVIAVDSQNSIQVLGHAPSISEISTVTSGDAGATWSAVERITWTTGFSYSPAVAIDSLDIVHIVWEDSSPGNYEVYYKRKT